MKFNRCQIMRAAWRFRRLGLSASESLARAWRDAKLALVRYSVIGQRIGHPQEVIASGLTYDQAGELEWRYRFSYDRVEIKVA